MKLERARGIISRLRQRLQDAGESIDVLRQDRSRRIRERNQNDDAMEELFEEQDRLNAEEDELRKKDANLDRMLRKERMIEHSIDMQDLALRHSEHSANVVLRTIKERTSNLAHELYITCCSSEVGCDDIAVKRRRVG